MALSVERITARVDALQRRHAWLGFPIAVLKKTGDDRGGQLAALITYYSFFSLFPLLLVAFTILGFVLGGNPDLRDDVAVTLRERLPLPGISADSLSGSGLALVVGVVLTLWSGLGATQVAQDAMNTVWDVPRHRQPNFLMKRLWGLAALAVLGGGLLVATAVSQLGRHFGPAAPVLGPLSTFVVNALLVCIMIRVLTERPIPFGDLRWAAIVAGAGWTALQLVGGWYTQRLIDNADKTYGTFAVVIGLLSWLLLQAKVFIWAAEAASVASRGLWPRSLDPAQPTAADMKVADAITARDDPLGGTGDGDGNAESVD